MIKTEDAKIEFANKSMVIWRLKTSILAEWPVVCGVAGSVVGPITVWPLMLILIECANHGNEAGSRAVCASDQL